MKRLSFTPQQTADCTKRCLEIFSKFLELNSCISQVSNVRSFQDIIENVADPLF